MPALMLLLFGVALVVAGVALVFWPAALMVGGVAAICIALYVDFDVFGRGTK